MPKPTTGELRPLAHGWLAVITVKGKTRKAFTLNAFGPRDEAAARERTTTMATMAARLRRAGRGDVVVRVLAQAARATVREWPHIVTAVDELVAGAEQGKRVELVPTFAEFAEEWTSGRLHKRYPDHVRAKDGADDASRLRLYVNDHIGDRALDALTLDDFDRVLSALPSHLEPSSRRQVAQVIGRVMKLAAYPGRHIATSPIPQGWLPRLGKPKARGYIYPDEDATLLACAVAGPDGERKVPLWRRLLWGFMAREGTRGPSEALSFRWRHLDLVRGAVRLDVNKTDDPRVWSLTEGTVRALLAWRELTVGGTAPSDLVFVDEGGAQPHETTLAATFREDLRAAGVNRPELFEHNAHRRQIRAHDLRASFITVALANDRSETWVTDRTGHTTSGQLVNYRRAARTVKELALGDFVPLDEAIPELRGLPSECQAEGFRRRDSNPDKRIQKSSVDLKKARENAKNRGPVDPRSHEATPQKARTWQSVGNQGPSSETEEPGRCVVGNQPRSASPIEENRDAGASVGKRSTGPRGAALTAMYEQAATLASAGDVAGARALHEAIGKLLAAGAAGEVIDLNEARRNRER